MKENNRRTSHTTLQPNHIDLNLNYYFLFHLFIYLFRVIFCREEVVVVVDVIAKISIYRDSQTDTQVCVFVLFIQIKCVCVKILI